jgi:hypothetical protein
MPIIILRLISRILIAQKLWWDDWAILLVTVGFNLCVLFYHGANKASSVIGLDDPQRNTTNLEYELSNRLILPAS